MDTTLQRGPTPHPLADADRITANLNVYHEQRGLQPTHATGAFSVQLPRGSDAAYARRVQVREGWELLDCGWLADGAGALLLENQTREGDDRLPTDAERAAVDAAVVEVCCGEGDAATWTLPPRGGFLFGIQTNNSMLRVRCVQGVATLGIFACPQ